MSVKNKRGWKRKSKAEVQRSQKRKIFVRCTLLLLIFFAALLMNYSSDANITTSSIAGSFPPAVKNMITGAMLSIQPIVANETVKENITKAINETEIAIPEVISEPVEENERFEEETEDLEKVPKTENKEETTTITEPNLSQKETIGILAVPAVSNLVLNATNINNNTNQNLTAWWTTTDADSDDAKNITNWLLNGSSIAVLNMPFEKVSDSVINATKDYSGRDNNGSEIAGVTWNASGGYDSKGAFEFDGSNDYILVPTDSSLNFGTGSFSISLWIKFLNCDQFDTVIEKRIGNDQGWKIDIGTTDCKFRILLENESGTGKTFNSDSAWNDSAWHHVVVTADMSSTTGLKMYVDNTVQSSTRDLTNFGNISNSDDILIGRHSSYYLNGTLDDIILFNRSLSANQIEALYNNRSYLIVSQETSINDSWVVEVTPNDGTSDGTTQTSGNVTIRDNFSVTTPTITPSPAYTNDTLETNTTYSHGEGDAGTVYFLWYRNGTNIYNQTNTTISSGTTVVTYLDENNFSRDDLINVSVYANDGAVDSTTEWSSVLTVQNLVPELSSLTLNATDANNDTRQNLTINFSVSDADGNNIKNITNWLLNKTGIAVLNIPFENNGSDAGPNDYSGFNNNGTITGAVWNASGGYGGWGAYEFDGTGNTYIEITSSNNLNFTSENFTIMFWAKPTSTYTNSRVISKADYNENGYEVFIDGDDSQVVFRTYHSSAIQVSTTNSVITNNTWNHVTVVRSGSSATIYVNGADESNTNGTHTDPVASPYHLFIGTRADAKDVYSFNGTIDEVMIFNRSLSVNQIETFYNNRTDLIVSQETSKSDVWAVEVTPNDGTEDGATVTSNNLTITTNVPEVTTPVITPTTAYTNNTLEINTTYSDNDTDTATIYFEWSKNGTNVYNQTNSSISSGTTVFSYLDSNNFSKDDLINVSVYADDGTNNSSTKWSTVFTISNSAPIHTTPILRARDNPLNTVNANLTVLNQSTNDTDGDLVKNIYNWKLNGSSIAILNLPFENNGSNAGVNDYSGLGNNGTENGGVTWNATGGYDGWGAYEFDGDDDYISSTVNDNILTTVLWYKKPSSNWIHLINASGTTYVDNVATSNIQLPIYISGTSVSIGKNDSSTFFNGTIDEVIIFNRTLSTEQIEYLYRNRTDVLGSNETAADDIWSVEITPNDGTEDGTTLVSNNVTIASVYNISDFNNGLVGYWSLDEDDRNTSHVFDTSGQGNNGTIYNITPVAGNNSLPFDGVGSYVEISSNDLYDSGEAGEMTFSALFYSPNYSSKQVILSRRHSCNNEGHFNIYVRNNYVYLTSYSNYDTTTKRIYAGKLRNGNQYRIFWLSKWNQTGTRFFINDVERYVNNDANTRGTSTAYSHSVLIGAQNSGATCNGPVQSYFNGTIDEIAIWNRTLSLEEMDNFSRDTHSEFNTTLYYINNSYVNLTIDQGGFAESLLSSNGTEQLDTLTGISRIHFNDSYWVNPKSFTDLGNNTYRVKYFDSSTEITLNITPGDKYLYFAITNISNQTDDIEEIEVYNLDLINLPQSDESWAAAAADDTLFFNFLPTQVETSCGLGSTTLGTCGANKWLGFTNGSAVLMTSNKSEYESAIQELITDYNSPNTTLNGNWFRTANKRRDSYLLTAIYETNYLNLLNLAQKGNIKVLLLSNILTYGHYNETTATYFSNQSSFYDALDEFIANNTEIGVHTFLNRVSSSDSLFFPVNETLYKESAGTLSASISATDTTITLSDNLSLNSYFTHFDSLDYTRNDYYSFIIGEELFRCSSYSSNQLSGCLRGVESTNASTHSAGVQVYVAPYYVGYFIDPDNEAVKDNSTEYFAEFARRFNLSLIYADGTDFVGKPEMSSIVTSSYRDKVGLVPYLNKLDTIPPCQSGDGFSSYAWFYQIRAASNDGVIFKNKDFSKYSKWDAINDVNPYQRLSFREFGWWKIHGANFSTNTSDFDSVTFDDIHYVMTKALTMNTSVGIQLSTSYDEHALLNESFDLIGLYHDLIDEDISNKTVPQHIKDYLSQRDREAEVSNVSGWNLVEKEVNRQYLSWNSTENASFNITNPFANQKLRIEIRPRFDYYEFNDSNHTTISNFTELSSSNITTEGDDVVCTINSQGVVDINNSGSSSGQCKIAVAESIDLTQKRGIGLSVTGDNGAEEVIVHLVDSSGNAHRDFLYQINFSEERNLTLGDPATTGTLGWDNNLIKRHWNYGYSSNTISIYISVDPGDNYSLQFHSLKGLQEKSSNLLVSPTITVDGESITFPVNLSVDEYSPYLIEYDGNSKKYNVSTSLYALNSTSQFSTDNTVVSNGVNTINISSDTSDSDYFTRAEVRISVYDDEDGDQIPTNGTYNGSSRPCTGSNNFCDDNCPSVSNPTQADADGDGVGDACEAAIVVSDGGSRTSGLAEAIRSVVEAIIGTSEQKSWDYLEEGERVTTEFENENLAVTQISFTTGKSVEEAWLKVSAISRLPLRVKSFAGEIYQRLKIEEEKVGAALRGTATIRFKVAKKWLDKAGLDKKQVALYRYVNQNWVELKTIAEHEGENDVYYTAETPGFSYFIIGKKEIKAEIIEEVIEEVEPEKLPLFGKVWQYLKNALNITKKLLLAGKAIGQKAVSDLKSNYKLIVPLFTLLIVILISSLLRRRWQKKKRRKKSSVRKKRKKLKKL